MLRLENSAHGNSMGQTWGKSYYKSKSSIGIQMPHNLTFRWNLDMMSLWEQRTELWPSGVRCGSFNNGEIVGLRIQNCSLDKRHGPCDALRSVRSIMSIVGNNVLYFKMCGKSRL